MQFITNFEHYNGHYLPKNCKFSIGAPITSATFIELTLKCMNSSLFFVFSGHTLR